MARHVARTFQLDPGPSLVRFRLNCLVTGNPPPASPTAEEYCATLAVLVSLYYCLLSLAL